MYLFCFQKKVIVLPNFTIILSVFLSQVKTHPRIFQLLAVLQKLRALHRTAAAGISGNSSKPRSPHNDTMFENLNKRARGATRACSAQVSSDMSPV